MQICLINYFIILIVHGTKWLLKFQNTTSTVLLYAVPLSSYRSLASVQSSATDFSVSISAHFLCLTTTAIKFAGITCDMMLLQKWVVSASYIYLIIHPSYCIICDKIADV